MQKKFLLTDEMRKRAFLSVAVITSALFIWLTGHPTFCATLWDVAGSAGKSMTTSFATFYDGIFFPLFLVLAAGWLISKDPKVKGAWRMSCIGSVVVLIVIKMEQPIKDTINAFAGFFTVG